MLHLEAINADCTRRFREDREASEMANAIEGEKAADAYQVHQENTVGEESPVPFDSSEHAMDIPYPKLSEYLNIPEIRPVAVPASEFAPLRSAYPEYEAEHPAALWLHDLYRKYLAPLGMDVAFRTMRQSQLYWDLLADVVAAPEQLDAMAKNFIVLQKVLPKFTFDGKIKVRVDAEDATKERWEIVRTMEQDLQDLATGSGMSPNMNEELHRMRISSESSDRIFNYWA